MRRLARALGALSLTLCAGGAVALAPDRADAQGKGRKSWQQNDKQYRKELKRQAKAERKEARRLGAARLYDRRDDRWDDRRNDRRNDRFDDRYDARYDRRRVVPSRRVPVRTYNSGSFRVPPGHMPPPGMCRIWIDGVPPGRQPRATTCAAAERNRPYNARVIYGTPRYGDFDDRRDGGVYDRSRTRYPDGRTVDPRIPLPPRTVPLPFP